MNILWGSTWDYEFVNGIESPIYKSDSNTNLYWEVDSDNNVVFTNTHNSGSIWGTIFYMVIE